MTAAEFSRRARRVYSRLTNGPPEGWMRWFASEVRKEYTTVWRWANGKSKVNPAAVVILERLEEDAGIRPPATGRSEV